jgi:2-methylcitrate dehydratase
MSNDRSNSTGTALRLAQWVEEFARSPMSGASLEFTRLILLDSLACALHARGDEKAEAALVVAGEVGRPGGCTLIGTRERTSLPMAAFANGVLIRTLDLNDTYVGPRQVGHPSDNIGAALAGAEVSQASGSDLVRAIRLGYEIYGRILDLGNPESPWDHVTVSGLVTAAMLGWLLRLPREQLAHAAALAAVHCATLGEVRVGQISAAKSMANAVVVQTAALLTLLAAQGMTGPAHALEGDRGYANLILEGVDFGAFFDSAGPQDRILSVGIKQFPCFALAQGPISAAIELRNRVMSDIGAIETVDIAIANTGPARLRLRDAHGRSPTSREAADHSIYFLVAIALLDGRVTLEQFKGDRWTDPDVHRLIARMSAGIDPALEPAATLPCRLDVTLKGGQTITVHRAASPGSPAAPLTRHEVEDKFRQCAAGVLDAEARQRVIDLVGRIEQLPSVAPLLSALAP